MDGKRLIPAVLACAVAAAGRASEAGPTEEATLRAGGLVVSIERKTGAVRRLRVGPALETMSRWPLAGYLEIVDLRDRKTYDPSVASAIGGWRVGGGDEPRSLSFRREYEGAPFGIEETFEAADDHLRWTAVLRLLGERKENRSVRVNWVLPLPGGWRYWSPRDLTVRRADGVSGYRAVYGHAGFGPHTTIIPLVSAWGRRGGLVCYSPPDVRKSQIIFEVDPHGLPDPPRGMSRLPGDLPRLRVAHHLVGLRAGKPLALAVCLAGVKPGWRPALGHYVHAHPQLFEPAPAARKLEGMYAITGSGRMSRDTLRQMRQAGVTFVELHGSFPEYGIYMTEEMLADPDLTVPCKPHPRNRVSLRNNRRWIGELNKASIAPFMYFYNCHALPATINKRWPAAGFEDERGRPLLKWYTEPSVYGPPGSPFGKHMVRQMELMLKAYPAVGGFFVDNFGIEMVSFAHDDGVTMIRNRPAYDLNRNHQGLGPVCFAKAHAAGKLIMINKLATIESARGADMVLTEGNSLHSVTQHALACVFRAVFPLGAMRGMSVEQALQHLLLLGGTPEEGLYRRDPETMKAYRPLTDAMIGKRWVLTRDPLTVPRPYAGQVFRIDKHAAGAGDVVVALVDLNRSWRQKRFTEGLTVKVRLPDAGELKKATWLAAYVSLFRKGA